MLRSTLRRTSCHDTVQLPSGTTLEYILVRRTSSPPPSTTDGGNQSAERLAICLHPWSRLGGRMNDPVLQLLTEPLLESGYDVLRYNSRGVGNSTGWASFTGIQEADDLQELVRWAKSTMPSITSLVLVGYSHGSLVASMHSVLEDVKTSHILLSYPMGPRHWLTAFHGHRYTSALQSLIHDPRSNVLIVYGDEDDFTSVETYDRWVASLKESSDGSERGSTEAHGVLEAVKVEGASHFWREDHAVDRLIDVVRGWLS